MTIVWKKPLRAHTRIILQEAGYHEFYDRNTQKTSFIFRLGRSFYPRFHIYDTMLPVGVELDLHLDQKKSTLAKNSAHGGEYDGDQVEEETKRLMRWLEYYTQK